MTYSTYRQILASQSLARTGIVSLSIATSYSTMIYSICIWSAANTFLLSIMAGAKDSRLRILAQKAFIALFLTLWIVSMASHRDAELCLTYCVRTIAGTSPIQMTLLVCNSTGLRCLVSCCL